MAEIPDMSTFPDRSRHPTARRYRLGVTRDRRAADDGVHGCVVTIATRLEQQVSQISTAITVALQEQVLELRGDAQMIEMLAASVQANVEMIFHALLHDTPFDRISAPKPALDYARRVAQHDVPVNALVRGYRIGQRHMTELVFAELRALDVEPTTRVAVIEAITTVVFEYVDRVSQQVVAEYEDERVPWLENQNSIRAMRVRDVLSDSTTVDGDAASATIRYPLHWQHLALIVWLPDREATGDELTRIQRFTRDLAATVDAPVDPLFAAADRSSAWIWLPFRSAPGDITAGVREYASARTDSLNIAMGAVGTGIDGFRRSHRQAQRVRTAVLARGSQPEKSDRVIAAATDSDMMAAALLDTAIGEVRDWVSDVLGGLATHTEDDGVLRETLRVFLHSGSTHETAARELNLTFSALKGRVERAVARRGRPIDDRVDVELALFVCHWYGAAVLRPA
ncbi:MAG: hypothetical protein QOG37_1434 [Mycobacterium sp.]|nr:hypothetical protein [Mycobacterium sp.]